MQRALHIYLYFPLQDANPYLFTQRKRSQIRCLSTPDHFSLNGQNARNLCQKFLDL